MGYDREEIREQAGAYKLSMAEAMEGSEFEGEPMGTQGFGECTAAGNESPPLNKGRNV